MPPRISKDLENNISSHLLRGETDRQVARDMHVNHQTVARVRRAIMPDMPVSKGGRPRQWSETDVKNIKLQVQRGEEETAASLARNFRFHGGHTLSVDTMERILHKYKYMAYLKGRKPMLSKLNQQKRLQFAKSVAHWTKEQWRRVIFSDESAFPLYPTSGREWFWKHRNEPVRPRQVRPTMQHGGGS